MHARLGLHLRKPVLVKLVGQVLRVLQRIGRIEIVIGYLRIFVVELRLFRQNIVDGRPSIAHQLALLYETLHDGNDVLHFGVVRFFGTNSRLYGFNRLPNQLLL